MVTYTKTCIQVFRLLGVHIRDSVQRMSLFLIIWLRLSPVTLPQYSLQICHRHACWLPIVLCNQLLEPLHDPFVIFRSVDFRNRFHWNFQPPTISTPRISPLYVYNLVFGRSSETNGVGKQHWWDWGRFEDICAEALTWLVSLKATTWQAVWESGIL